MKRAAIIALVIVGIAAAGWMTYTKFSPGPDKNVTGKTVKGGGPGTMVPVIVALVGPHDMTDRIEAIGTAKANESIILTAKVTETVRRINFEDGARVKKGDILVELTTREVAAQLKAAEAKVHETVQQYKRIADLVKRKAASESRLDQQIAARDTARAEAEALRVRIADRIIRAPFDGATGLRLVSPGALVVPGTQITSLDDVRIIKLDFGVPETLLGDLKKELPVNARSAAYPGKVFKGTVKSIDSRVNPATRAVTVRAHLPNPEHLLKPGMLLTVALTARQSTVLAIPEEAVIPVSSRQFVFTVAANGTVARKEIKIGRRRPGMIEVVAGLAAGERVITEGTIRVRPGMKVRVIQIRSAPATKSGATPQAPAMAPAPGEPKS